jgi:hypothetical protein
MEQFKKEDEGEGEGEEEEEFDEGELHKGRESGEVLKS